MLKMVLFSYLYLYALCHFSGENVNVSCLVNFQVAFKVDYLKD
jgi:hypothetical protein